MCIRDSLKLDVTTTQRRGHAADLARQARTDGLDVVLVLGGDGTVNEVVNGLLAAGPGPDVPALAVVPGGCTNVFARNIGLPTSPVEATSELLDALRAGRRQTLGLGQVDERWFTFCAGIGFDAEVVQTVERKRRHGRRATPVLYLRSAVEQFVLATDRRRPTPIGGQHELLHRRAQVEHRGRPAAMPPLTLHGLDHLGVKADPGTEGEPALVDLPQTQRAPAPGAQRVQELAGSP